MSWQDGRPFPWARALFFAVSSVCLAGCTAAGDDVLSSAAKPKPAHINSKTKFSSARYGVKASPRLTTSRTVRKGGGRRQLGKPYKIKGKWYTPKEQPGYDKKGMASWYGPNFHGRLTANGEVYDQYALSAAHPTFPLPSYARVTNRKNGRSVIVRVNDRGPYHEGRVIDLSAKAAELLDYQSQGVAKVRVQYIGPAPLHGLDHKYLIASYKPAGGPAPAVAPPVMVALNNAARTQVAARTQGHAGAGPRPPASVLDRGPLDGVVTGSVSKPKARDDFFVQQLRAAQSKRETNSTIQRRLKAVNAQTTR